MCVMNSENMHTRLNLGLSRSSAVQHTQIPGVLSSHCISQVWPHTPVVPTLRKWMQRAWGSRLSLTIYQALKQFELKETLQQRVRRGARKIYITQSLVHLFHVLPVTLWSWPQVVSDTVAQMYSLTHTHTHWAVYAHQTGPILGHKWETSEVNFRSFGI